MWVSSSMEKHMMHKEMDKLTRQNPMAHEMPKFSALFLTAV